jgi:hypothetical protein
MDLFHFFFYFFLQHCLFHWGTLLGIRPLLGFLIIPVIIFLVLKSVGNNPTHIGSLEELWASMLVRGSGQGSLGNFDNGLTTGDVQDIWVSISRFPRINLIPWNLNYDPTPSRIGIEIKNLNPIKILGPYHAPTVLVQVEVEDLYISDYK